MRSTFIVGFPGESDEHVDYLEDWIGRAQLDRVGFFEYSAEEGTPAAELPIGPALRRRRERLIRLREAQRLASRARAHQALRHDRARARGRVARATRARPAAAAARCAASMVRTLAG